MLHGFLDPLYRHAERRGCDALVRENALRLLERAHVERLTGGEEAPEAATKALDRYAVLAARGDADAAFQVAEAHRTGFGRPRNHWKALEHYRMALDLGHPEAPRRLRQLEEGEPVEDPAFEAFGRRALLRSTYAPDRGRRHVRSLAEGARELRREGVGRRGVRVLLGSALALGAYLALDIYFFGMGAWRPDPGRVVWGLFGKIHPPKGTGLGRVLPGWLRPYARSVTFELADVIHQRAGSYCLGDFQGKVVFLHLVDGRHPTIHEAVPYLRKLDARRGPDFESFILYVRRLERAQDVHDALQWALEIAPAVAPNAKAVRPLGTVSTYPANFVIDRKGRIRQRWTGFSEALTEEAIQGALAENDKPR
ncbi:hypothetical protein METEAL_28250 [Mesoterricola silvestris]|uniref:Uncharacterized protein n=2 Tax=Mesoterricola silvestris TaxID=2927979 RepID=A0AA48GXF3_9BACT|nr:hypothetical protein METEAL_28250 [Mesoterricola silvestris]